MMKFFKHTKEIIYLMLSAAVVFKILQININSLSLPDNLTNLLSLILAIFSIWLSALFYFKANDASNQFYNNTYQFTKDISEKIGRIEERFGKDLSNIEKGYTRMLDKMDRISNPESIEKEIETKTNNETRLFQEKEEILNEIMKKANISEEEKRRISSQLNAKEIELEHVKKELFDLKNQLEEAKYTYVVPPHTKNITKFLINSIKHGDKMPRRFTELVKLIEERIGSMEDKDINILINEGIITTDLKLTSKGKTVFLEFI